MLPVCSATPTSCSHSQISFPDGLQPTFGYLKSFKASYLLNGSLLTPASNGTHFSQISYKTLVVKGSRTDFVVKTGQLESVDGILSSPSADVVHGLQEMGTRDWSSSMETVRVMPGHAESTYVSTLDVVSDNSTSLPESTSIDSDSLSYFRTDSDNVTSLLNEPVDSATIDIVPDNSVPLSDLPSVGSDSLSGLRLNTDEVTSGLNIPIATKIDETTSSITSSVDAITSSLEGAITKANDSVSHAFSQFSLTINQTEKSAGSRLESFWLDAKQATGRAGVAAVDVLRHAIVTVEDSLSSGASLVGYSYGFAKELLPPEIRDVLNVSEETATKILVPVGSALQQEQASVFIVGLERNLGLDPDDPIVPFAIFLGTSTSLWILYQRKIYGGYAGDLSPNETFALLMGKENAVLIDVRPEELRERDGIPDLRRGARFRYASVDLPDFDSSVKKLLKSGRDLDDSLIAVVIKNLKIVQGKSKVVIMDVDGSRSKGIARSLRKLGIKGSYLMEGGFRCWVKQGLRIKELKPETTLTILNEEAEAILEEINPTPIQVLGSGLGLLAACYAVLEWEKTLQLIGLVGIGLTIYWRVSNYNDAEDLKKDVRLLFAPVKMGVAALSWASGKLETNGIGLPTSPSSLDVQSRVLKAVAKHESQPSEPKEMQDDPSSDSASPVVKGDL
ncbi:unnamed protein product [Rhodiola kirilowii]